MVFWMIPEYKNYVIRYRYFNRIDKATDAIAESIFYLS